MILTDRKLYVLVILAGVLSALAIILYARKPAADRDLATGTPLVQGLDMDKVARVVVSKGSAKITLARQGKLFVVAEHSNYPASAERVNKLIISLLDVRADGRVTTNAANHAELGVAATSPDATVVRIYGAAGAAATEPAQAAVAGGPAASAPAASDKQLVAVIVGKDAPAGGGQYVRLDGQDAVYTSANRPSFSTDFAQYVNSSLVSVPATDVEKVTVQTKEGSYELARGPGGAGVAMTPMPQAKQLKTGVAQTTLEALSSLPFEDVMTADSMDSTALAFDAGYTCRTKINLTYSLRLGTKGDDHYVRVTCLGPSAAQVTESRRIGEQDAKDKLEKKSAILLAADKAQEFNDANGKWIYKISKWTAEKLRRPATDLLEDIPASQPAAAPGAGTTLMPPAAQPGGAEE